MIIVLSVFNGGQTHSVGCPHIGFEAVKEIRVLFCTTAIFEVVVCESVNECPPDGSIIGAGVVADVSGDMSGDMSADVAADDDGDDGAGGCGG